MILIDRYGIGPTYHTPHPFNQMRQVYRLGNITVYLDRENKANQTKRCELFVFCDGPLWCLGEFPGYTWAIDERMAERMIDEWRGQNETR